MKIRILVPLLFAALSIYQPVYADDDICRLGAQAIGMDAKGVDSFFQDRIKGLTVVGAGTVVEVTKGAGDRVERNYTVLVDCGNKVMILLQAGAFWVQNIGLRQGGPVSFRGQCLGLERIEGAAVRCIVAQQD